VTLICSRFESSHILRVAVIEGRATFDGMASVPSFMEVSQLVRKLLSSSWIDWLVERLKSIQLYWLFATVDTLKILNLP
jgi:hypothetical protein